MREDYPGQAYFHLHNANIKRAEESWERRVPNQERTSPVVQDWKMLSCANDSC